MSVRDGRSTTRDRLIDAAIDELVHVGAGNTSWGTVCATAGTTKGVVTHHFPGGKEELVVAAVERNAAQVDRLLAQVEQEAGDVGDTLVRFFDLYAALLERDPARGCPVAASVVDASATSEAVRRATVDAFGGWIDTLTALVGDRDVAATIVATMEGSILLARAARDPDLLRRTGRVLAAQLRT